MVRLLLALGAMCVLGACTLKPVEVVNPPHFVDMAHLLKDDMVQHSVLDVSGEYLEPSVFHDASVVPNGGELFGRLSCAFRYSPNRKGVPLTFAAVRPAKKALKLTAHGFVLSQGTDVILLELVAITDWNGDGKKDWLVRCIVKPFKDLRRKREYYLVAENIPAQGVVELRLLAMNDCLNGKCRLYRSVPQEKMPEVDPLLEGKPGQRAVTSPPGQNIPPDSVKKGLEERTLTK